MSIYNEEYMKAALQVAQEAYDNLEVPVGCVFVKDNQTIIAQGRNRPNETFNVGYGIYLDPLICSITRFLFLIGYSTCRD